MSDFVASQYGLDLSQVPPCETDSFPMNPNFQGYADSAVDLMAPYPGFAAINQTAVAPWQPLAVAPQAPAPASPLAPPRIHMELSKNTSRAETQFMVNLWLDPLDERYEYLHFPRWALAKPKQFAGQDEKQTIDPASVIDVDLHLVCEAALSTPEDQARALRRASGEETTPRRDPTVAISQLSKEDPAHPQNGGAILMCEGCKERERKRHARKVEPKPDDEREKEYQTYNFDRVIMINHKEYMKLKEPDQHTPAGISLQAKQVEFQARIACYSRHQECRQHDEKTPSGYRVIFTFRDAAKTWFTQYISPAAFHITDDHKNKGATPETMASLVPYQSFAHDPYGQSTAFDDAYQSPIQMQYVDPSPMDMHSLPPTPSTTQFFNSQPQTPIDGPADYLFSRPATPAAPNGYPPFSHGRDCSGAPTRPSNGARAAPYLVHPMNGLGNPQQNIQQDPQMNLPQPIQEHTQQGLVKTESSVTDAPDDVIGLVAFEHMIAQQAQDTYEPLPNTTGSTVNSGAMGPNGYPNPMGSNGLSNAMASSMYLNTMTPTGPQNAMTSTADSISMITTGYPNTTGWNGLPDTLGQNPHLNTMAPNGLTLNVQSSVEIPFTNMLANVSQSNGFPGNGVRSNGIRPSHGGGYSTTTAVPKVAGPVPPMQGPAVLQRLPPPSHMPNPTAAQQHRAPVKRGPSDLSDKTSSRMCHVAKMARGGPPLQSPVRPLPMPLDATHLPRTQSLGRINTEATLYFNYTAPDSRRGSYVSAPTTADGTPIHTPLNISRPASPSWDQVSAKHMKFY
jgi:hypothetical protein